MSIVIYIIKKIFKNSLINGDGGTSMSEIPKGLEKILNNFNSNKTICKETKWTFY